MPQAPSPFTSFSFSPLLSLSLSLYHSPSFHASLFIAPPAQGHGLATATPCRRQGGLGGAVCPERGELGLESQRGGTGVAARGQSPEWYRAKEGRDVGLRAWVLG